ncbi:MFS transporter [Salinicoccus sesuvii]
MVKVYQMTNSVFATSMIVGLMAISSFFSGMIVTKFIHKFQLKSILIISSFLRIFVIIGIYIFLSLNLENALYIVLLLLVFQSFLGAWSTPARQSLIPALFERYQLREVNTFVSTTNEIVRLVGWSIGGILSYYLNFTILVVMISVLLLLSILFISLIQYNQYIESRKKKIKGFRNLFENKVVFYITLVDMMESVANTIWTSALLLSFSIYVLNSGEIIWGYINATYFLGSIIGSVFLITIFKNKDFELFRLIIICGFAMGMLTLTMTLSSSIPVVLIATFLMGPIYQIRSIYQTTALQIYTSDENRTNIFSARSAILTPWHGVAVMGMGLMADWVGITSVYLLSSILYTISSCLVMFLYKSKY